MSTLFDLFSLHFMFQKNSKEKKERIETATKYYRSSLLILGIYATCLAIIIIIVDDVISDGFEFFDAVDDALPRLFYNWASIKYAYAHA